jgi:hypothetical protein
MIYLFVVLLHGLWDGLPDLVEIVVPPGVLLPVAPLVISILGVAALIGLYGQALRQQTSNWRDINPT